MSFVALIPLTLKEMSLADCARLIYLVAGMAICSKCNKTSNILRFVKCALCFKPVCDECVVRRYAQKFCSGDCARSFFFGTGEEEDEEQ